MSSTSNSASRLFAFGLLGFAVAAAAATAGCQRTSYPGASQAVIGTGFVDFHPISEGEYVPIIHGGQGGFHVWGAVLVRYMDPGRLTLVFKWTLDDGTPVLTDRPETAETTPFDPSVVSFDGGWPSPENGDGAPLDVPRGLTSFTLPGGADGWSVALANFMFLPDDPSIVDKKMARIHVDVTDASGRRCSDEKRFVPYRPSGF